MNQAERTGEYIGRSPIVEMTLAGRLPIDRQRQFRQIALAFSEIGVTLHALSGDEDRTIVRLLVGPFLNDRD